MKEGKSMEKKAEEFAMKKFVFTDSLKPYNEEMYVSFIAGWQEQDKEIERLKGLIKESFFFMQGHPRDGFLWGQFKSLHNL